MAKKSTDLFASSASLRLPKKGKMLSFEHAMGKGMKMPKMPKMGKMSKGMGM